MEVAAIIAFVLSLFMFASIIQSNGYAGKFFRFEKLLIKGFLEYLYILVCLLVLFVPLPELGIGWLFCGIILAIPIRLAFEGVMIIVLIWENTSVIKDALTARAEVPKNPAVSPAASPAASAGNPSESAASAENPSQAPATAPTVPSHAAFTQQESAPADTSWTCEYCGYTNPRGSFCAVCGKQKHS